MAEDEVSSKLRSWVQDAIGEIPVHFAQPPSDPVQSGIFFFLLGLQPNLALRNDPNRRIEIFRRYLVCDGDPAGNQVEELLFRALETNSWQVEPEPPSPDLWIALGIPMRPTFILRAPVARDRPARPAPPVKVVDLSTSLANTLTGFVRSPDGSAVSRCTVELMERGTSVVTGYDGAFAFPSLVSTIGYRFRLAHQGREQFVDMAAGEGFTQPVVVTFNSAS